MIKLLLTVSMFVSIWVHSTPTDLNFDYDNIDTDLYTLSYEVEEEDVDEDGELIDEEIAKGKDNSKASGFKKKLSSNKDEEKNYDIQDMKKVYKARASHDIGSNDESDVYRFVDGLATDGHRIAGDETRKYKKGTKVKGYHRVQHKDDFMKDKEFYQDDETRGIIKKVGAKNFAVKVGGDIKFNRGDYHQNHDKGVFGARGKVDSFSGKKKYKGYRDVEGFDEYF